MSVVQSFLTSKKSIFFFWSCKGLYESDNNHRSAYNPHLFPRFLQCVARGNQDQADAMSARCTVGSQSQESASSKRPKVNPAGRFFYAVYRPKIQ